MSLVFTAILNHDKLRFAVSHPQAQEKYDVSGSPVYNFDGKGVPSATSPLLHTSPLISSPTVVASTAASEFAEVPVVAGLPGPGIPERQMVFVSHLLKSAGTSAHHLVAKFMCSPKVYARQGFFYTECSPDAVKELNRQQTLYGNSLPLKNLKKAREKFFTIGMARNPCAYLVSMWAFVSKMRKTGPRAAHSSWQIPCLEKRLGKNATESLWQSESAGPTENVDRFRKWVRQSAGRTMHIHTFRSWLALHADEEVKKFPLWDDGQYYACMADVDAARENRIVDALKEVNLNDRYDCFVRSEHMTEEILICLERFTAQLRNETQKNRMRKRLERVRREGLVKVNPSKHQSCDSYFDDATRKFVWSREGPFAQRVGYDKCCEAARRPVGI